MVELTGTLGTPCQLGESVLWDWRAGQLWWVDISGCRLFCWDASADELASYSCPERPTAVGLRKHGLIVALESGFATWSPGEAPGLLFAVEPDNPGSRLNDGRVDRLGHFWAGTMIEDAARASAPAKLYRLDPEHGAVIYRQDIAISNGLCWDAQGTRMYFADSPSGEILVADVRNGEPQGFEHFAIALPGAHPDGATVDSQGFVWSAQWGSGAIVRYAPNGSIDQIVEVPCPQPTCVAFGGEGLQQLFVTSAREGLTDAQLEQYPESGRVFVFATPYAGVPESICQAP